MKRWWLQFLCLGLLASLLIEAVRAKEQPGGLEVLVSADAIPSPEGFRPKPGAPIRFVFTQTRQSLGDAIGGVKLPSPELVEQAVVAELAKQGFVRTEVGGPMPQIIIMAIVGDANFEEPPIAFDRPDLDPDFRPYLDMVNVRQLMQMHLIGSSTGSTPSLESIFDDAQQSRTMDMNQLRDAIVEAARRIREQGSQRAQDRSKIEALVGAPKVVHAVETHALNANDGERFVWATRENRLYIAINAFDAARWTKKERVLLWRTVMLIDWRNDFAKSLATMLARAGPVFGTDVEVPAFLNDQRKAKVDIGELKVIPDTPPAAPTAAKK
jgi:hypothetical protein